MAHILLIEPDYLLGKMYVGFLKDKGHSVTLTRSAQQAVHFADEKSPDVVVMEIQLKGHNGIEFLYEFRSYSEWLHIPIIINSFVPHIEFSRMPMLTKELGVKTYLYKPTTTLEKLGRSIELLVPTIVT